MRLLRFRQNCAAGLDNLGLAAVMNKLEVRWPRGREQEFDRISANAIYEINTGQELGKAEVLTESTMTLSSRENGTRLVYNETSRMRRTHHKLKLILAIAVAVFGPFRLDSQEVSPQVLYDQAGEALDGGNAAQAIKLYEELLRKAPDSIEARINLGVALSQEGRYGEAVQQYRQVLVHNPRNEPALLNLSLAYYKQGDYGKARVELNRLHELSPDNQQAFYLLADCELRLGSFQDAIALVEPAYEAHPDDQALEYILGTALIQDGQTQKGAAVIDHMMRNGNASVAGVLIGASQFAAGDYKTAAATLRKSLDLNPALPGAWTIYGRALLGSGENEEAKSAFRRALQADPNDFDACLHLGALLRHDGDIENAAPYLRHAFTLRPDSVQAIFQVSALDAATGHLEESRSGFEKLVKQWPEFVEAHVQLALVYTRLHRTEDSERERRIVVELSEKPRSKKPQPDVAP